MPLQYNVRMIPDPNKFYGNQWLARKPFVPLDKIPMPVKRDVSASPVTAKFNAPSATHYPDPIAKTHDETHLEPQHHEEPTDWKPVDFTRGQLLKKGVSDTNRFRYGLNKQLKESFLNSAQRAEVSKMLTGNISSSGLGMRNVKRGLWKLQSQGTLTKGQTQRLMKNLGIH